MQAVALSLRPLSDQHHGLTEIGIQNAAACYQTVTVRERLSRPRDSRVHGHSIQWTQ